MSIGYPEKSNYTVFAALTGHSKPRKDEHDLSGSENRLWAGSNFYCIQITRIRKININPKLIAQFLNIPLVKSNFHA